ncbi:glycosyl transferase family 1, partial [bacterium]|nr:glycosyl transferase family 1 [bacterium]
MNILFLHRSFPGQFKYLASAMALDKNNKVVFITEDDKNQISGIEKRIYKPEYTPIKKSKSKIYDIAVAHGKAAQKVAQELKNEGFVPDVIYGFSGWGTSLFIKEVYPNV